MAAALEDELLRRGVACSRARGRSASTRPTTASSCAATTVARPRGATRCSPSARSRTARGWGSTPPAWRSDAGGYVPGRRDCRTNVPHIYAAGDLSGKLPLSSVAAMQGRRIAEHADGRAVARPTASSTTTRRPRPSSPCRRSPTSGLAEADAFAEGRKVRVTKVPFSASPKALIESHSRGFVKIVSDPATGVVLGGSIVGRHAGRADLGDRGRRHQRAAGHRHRRQPPRAPVAVRGPGRGGGVAVPALTGPALVAAALLVLAGAQKLLDPTMTVGALRALRLPSSPRWCGWAPAPSWPSASPPSPSAGGRCGGPWRRATSRSPCSWSRPCGRAR